ncbi:hypothetical protein L218DRAFT_945564 [Marasmius fiardii PR-910]|nr:hypothetical protein L218DRAFT_945564 [Marasmius fiardii PR-910]
MYRLFSLNFVLGIRTEPTIRNPLFYCSSANSVNYWGKRIKLDEKASRTCNTIQELEYEDDTIQELEYEDGEYREQSPLTVARSESSEWRSSKGLERVEEMNEGCDDLTTIKLKLEVRFHDREIYIQMATM